jgi:heavy metal translocating P-type ATPase
VVKSTGETGGCDHCHLPLPPAWWGGSARGRATDPVYCCFGCRLAASVSSQRGEKGAASRTLARLGLAAFFTMNVMAFTMALWASDVYLIENAATPGFAATFNDLFRYTVLMFALPVLFLLGWPLWENAISGARRGVFSTDLLLAAGVAASFAFSGVSVARGSGPVYFEVGCVVLVMVTLGRWLEATGRLTANDALDRLARLMPDQVRRARDGAEENVSRSEIASGDVLHVLAGERIPADGRIRRGLAFVDEQVLTGESSPACRQPGDAVLGGTLNLDGDLYVEVEAAGADVTLSRLIELVRSARRKKGRYERLADRVSAWFVPIVSAIALATFIGHGLRSGWGEGTLRGLTVVLIACPCALGLATPLAVWSALGQAAGRQVLFQSGEALERLAEIRAVRFDKTGTLTTGDPTIARLECELADDRCHVIRHAEALAGASPHVLSRAILRMGSENHWVEGPIRSPIGRLRTTNVRTIGGRGVAAVAEEHDRGELTFLGSQRLMEENGQAIGPNLQRASRVAEGGGQSIAWVGWGGQARGFFLFDERLRPGAKEAIRRCQDLGLDVGVLTGDHAARGAALERELEIPVESALLPENKVSAIRASRERLGPVMMVGDGVNDAPALAASDLGVALGCGTDLSRESASVCLLGDDLDRLPWALSLARQAVRVIRGNLAWAFGYNAIGVACAAVGWLNPTFAAILMGGSSALVIVNSLRLRDAGRLRTSSEPIPTGCGVTPTIALNNAEGAAR